MVDASGRKQATDFPQELLDLLDSYVHGGIDRRTFIAGAQKFATAAVSAAAHRHGRAARRRVARSTTAQVASTARPSSAAACRFTQIAWTTPIAAIAAIHRRPAIACDSSTRIGTAR